MPQMIPILILRLEGVLQSWGEHAKWDYRDSASLPTKSGIIGLLGCALGLSRDNPKLIDLNKHLTIAIRADRRGFELVDFHTVQSKSLLNAMGKHRGNKGEVSTLVTHRTYLQDAYFTVAITGSEGLLKSLVTALRNPKWPLYLGRKCCVPTRPVLDGMVNQYVSLEEALRQIQMANRADNSTCIEFETKDKNITNGALIRRFDYPGTKLRTFLSRTVVRKVLSQGGEDDVSK